MREELSTQERRDFVRENYKTMSVKEMASATGASHKTIYRDVDIVDPEFRVIVPRDSARKYRHDFILNNYKTKSLEEIASELDCSYATIRQYYLGLSLGEYIPKKRKAKKSLVFKYSDIEFVKKNASRMTLRELAEATNHPYRRMQGLVYRLGLSSVTKRSSGKGSQKGKERDSQTYTRKLEFSQSLGFRNVSEAISDLGKYDFEQQFKKWSK